MNHLQRMWIKAYQDYLDAAKDRGSPIHTTDVFMARNLDPVKGAAFKCVNQS